MTLNKYFHGDELAASAWLSKYAVSGEKTPDDMHKRMAKEFAKIEDKYAKLEENIDRSNLSKYGKDRDRLTNESIYNLFKNFKYIVPQGSIMAMLGNFNKIGSLSNCFVIGQPEDSYGGIMQKDEQMAQLMKRRGGVGIDISTLRPAGNKVSNAAGTSTGAASFMHRYSNTTREVAQAGRRGALMITIDCRHPDVLEFVNIKKDRTAVTGANISVMLRDDFMQAVKEDKDYILRFPCYAEIPNYVVDYDKLLEIDTQEHGIIYIKKVRAKDIYDSIVENAWENAEPGQIFIDKHWNYSPDTVYDSPGADYKGITTNPCGEIFMGMYDACRLLALNLYSVVKNPFTDKAKVDYKLLYKISYEQQRLADDLIDLELEYIKRIINKIKYDPESTSVMITELELWENIYKVCENSRRTGCGFTALGDMLAALNLKYDSDEAFEVIDKVMSTKMEAELDCTIDLAILRKPFKGWDLKKEKIENYEHNRVVQKDNVLA